MRKYDFSKAERGKFYSENAEYCLPIYLNPDLAIELAILAEKKHTNLQILANDIIERSIQFSKFIDA